MEDATISEHPKQEPLYQQGRYPSIIDTDDLVFEMGKQVVNHINHEKLIGRIITQTDTLQKENLQLKSIQMDLDKRVAPFELKAEQLEQSNKLYEMNNRKLDEEIVRLREQITKFNSQLDYKDALIEQINTNHQTEITAKEEVYNIAVDKLKKEHKEEIEQVILDSKKKKPYTYR